jgi:hypothetical protein
MCSDKIILTNLSSDSLCSSSFPASFEALVRPMDESSDPRLATASQWTKVTGDKHFLALLLSAWHTWEYSYYHILDWNIFLEDMSKGRTDFCSELLVNALLATASVSDFIQVCVTGSVLTQHQFQSPLVKDRSIPFGDNIMTRFYKEAKELWKLSEGQETLPRLQAALCLFMWLGKHGRDKQGYNFLLEACRIARSMGLFRLQSASQKPPHISDAIWGKARAVSAWALFNFQL